MATLTPEMLTYVGARTNERGDSNAPQYGFESVQIVGNKQDYLNIVVVVLETGAVHGYSKKLPVDWDTDQQSFGILVDAVLTGVERHL